MRSAPPGRWVTYRDRIPAREERRADQGQQLAVLDLEVELRDRGRSVAECVRLIAMITPATAAA